MKKLFLCFLLLSMYFLVEQRVEASSETTVHNEILKSPKDTVDSLVKRALGVLNIPNVASENVSNEFQDIVVTFFATDSISKYVLGVNARKMTEDEKKKFTKCLINMVVKLYFSEFLKYKTGEFRIVQEKKASAKHTIVNSTFSLNGKIHKLDWSLFLVNDKWLIFDISVDGISVSKIQKAGIDGKISEIKRVYKSGIEDALKKFLESFASDYGDSVI